MEMMLRRKNDLLMRRSGAIAALVRLEIADIPIPHSKKCRGKLIEYLADILSESVDMEEDMYIEVNYEDIGVDGVDLESAVEILRSYKEY